MGQEGEEEGRGGRERQGQGMGHPDGERRRTGNRTKGLRNKERVRS